MTPHSQLLPITAAATVLLSLVFGLAGQDLPAEKKPYARTGQEASLVGYITFTGKPPKPLQIDMSADPSCYDHISNLKTEWFVVRNGRIANVLVYVTSDTLNNYAFEMPSSEVVLAHKNCRYEPHILGLRVGQSLSIVNSDETQHNTHPTPRANAEWSQTQVGGGPPIIKTFQNAEAAIPFKDNQHPWEKAYVGVFTHPFFAVTDMDGNYRIDGLPPGSYKVTAWHERLGEKVFDLVVAPGESRYVEFTFSTAEAKR
ncbi:MAG: carboxypeptidase regulatory-like domain-containing protein [Pyrinomonadaceae bacterium]